MRQFLTAIAGLVAIGGGIPYIIDTVKGKTHPNIVTWLTWSLLNGINAAAAFSHGDVQTAFFSACGTLITAAIFALGIKHGVRKYAPFDIACQAVALLGISIWLMTDKPELAVVIVIIVDLAGGLPTLRHAWKAPHEETIATFITSAAAGLLLLVSLEDYNFIAMAMPLYIFLFDSAVVFSILFRSRRLAGGA